MSKQAVRVGAYVRETIQEGESLHAVGEMHWAVFVRPWIEAMVMTVLIGFFWRWVNSENELPAVFRLVFLIPWIGLGMVAVRYFTTEAAVTSMRVLHKTGWISRRANEISISKVETVMVDQGVIGRMFGFGTVSVRGTGGHALTVYGICDPMAFRQVLQQVLAAR